MANATSTFYVFGLVGYEVEFDWNVHSTLFFALADEKRALVVVRCSRTVWWDGFANRPCRPGRFAKPSYHRDNPAATPY